MKYAIENGMIDETYIREQIRMNKRKELLEKHPYNVSQGKDGKWRTYLPDKEKGRRLVKKSTQQAIEDAVVEFWQEEIENPTVQAVFDEWTAKKLEYKEVTKGSIDRYQTDFNRFFVRSGFSERRIKQITTDELEDFIRIQIAENDLTAKAYSGLRIITKGIFSYAKKKKWTDISISEFFGDLTISKNTFRRTAINPEDEVLAEDEIPIVIDYLKSNGSIWDLGVLLALQTGLRVGELSTLKFSDWDGGDILKVRRTEVKEKDASGKSIHVVREFTKTAAGMRNVILSDGAVQTLEAARKINPDGTYIFENQSGKRILGKTFNSHLNVILKKLGLHHRTAHKLRKTYATMLIDAGCPDSLVTVQLGHSSIETTRKYYYYSNQTRANQIEEVKRAIKI